MYGDPARGRRSRELPTRSGKTVQECQSLAGSALAEARLSLAIEEADGCGDGCVVPRGAACLFVRGRNDPVIEYVSTYSPSVIFLCSCASGEGLTAQLASVPFMQAGVVVLTVSRCV